MFLGFGGNSSREVGRRPQRSGSQHPLSISKRNKQTEFKKSKSLSSAHKQNLRQAAWLLPAPASATSGQRSLLSTKAQWPVLSLRSRASGAGPPWLGLWHFSFSEHKCMFPWLVPTSRNHITGTGCSPGCVSHSASSWEPQQDAASQDGQGRGQGLQTVGDAPATARPHAASGSMPHRQEPGQRTWMLAKGHIRFEKGKDLTHI